MNISSALKGQLFSIPRHRRGSFGVAMINHEHHGAAVVIYKLLLRSDDSHWKIMNIAAPRRDSFSHSHGTAVEACQWHRRGNKLHIKFT